MILLRNVLDDGEHSLDRELVGLGPPRIGAPDNVDHTVVINLSEL